MKQQQSIALSAMVAVAVGLTGMSVFVDATSQPELTEAEILAEESGIYGHLEVVLKNADGETIAYRQTDNVVTTEGKECALEILFNGAAITNNQCPITTFPESFTSIQLISAGTPVVGDTQASNAGTDVSATDLTIADCTIADATGGDGTITCSHTFTAGTGVSGQVVTGAYLKDNTTPTAIFAGNTFTSVTMNDSDTLAVTWTISIT